MKTRIFVIFVTMLLLSQQAAARLVKYNIVVQSYSEIQKTNMYEPGFNPNRKKTIKSKKHKDSYTATNESDKVSADDCNKKIAGDLIQKDMSPMTIELLTAETQIKINVGQPLQVLLPEDENSPNKWYLGGNELKYVRISEDFYYRGLRVFNISILEPEKEKIFFDLIDDSKEKINILDSRVLNIMAE